MSDSPLWDPASLRTTFGFWSTDTRAECSVLSLNDLLSDPDGETLFLPNETAPENHRGPINIRPRRWPNMLLASVLRARQP